MRFFKDEKEFTRWALKQARANGWLAGHLSNHRVVRRPDGQVFAVPDKDADGFPDLILLHPEHGLVVAELKMPGRKPDLAQLLWLRGFRAAGVPVFVWEPADQDEIVELLRTGTPAPTLFDQEAMT